MKPLCPLRWALEQPDLLGPILAGESWAPWRTLLIAAIGEELTADERAVFAQLTGREHEPGESVEEAWFVVGRRGGKTRAVAVLAVFLAILVSYVDRLVAGERGVVAVLSASLWQAQRAFVYIRGIIDEVATFRELVVGETADTITLSNGIAIECRSASFRTIRGATLVAAICDELAFWRTNDESRNPDREVLDAVRPALASVGGPLIVISSPYAKAGQLWVAFKRDFGPLGDPLVLVAKASSRTMNPTLSARVVERAYERDPASARAEYDAEFRSDIANFVDAEIVEAAVSRGVAVRALIARQGHVGFVDPSGGSSDSMTLAIAHREGERFVLDVVLERRPPFSPDAVVREFAATLRGYRIGRVVGDRYAGEWPREAFQRRGVTYEPAEMVKSGIYLAFLPLINSGRINLLDHPRLVSQLCSLERRTARGGRDSIDHAPGAHDDLANAAAGALVMASVRSPMRISPELLKRLDRREPRVVVW
jgi:hypothetical protein